MYHFTFKNIINGSKELYSLALPIIVGNIGQMLIVLGDVFIAGRYSTDTLAALGIASGVINTIFIIGVGLIMISPVLSRRIGEKSNIEHLIVTTFAYSLIVSLFILLLSFIFIYFIESFGINPILLPQVKIYFILFTLSYPFAMIMLAIREFLQSKEKVVFVNLTIIFTAVLNLLIGFPLTFGAGDIIPELGIVGLGITAILVRFLIMCFLLCYFIRHYPLKVWLLNFDLSFINEVLRLCIPIALGLLVQLAASNGASSLLIGQFAPVQSAAHNVVINISTLVFMVPLSIAIAVSIKVGNAYGRKDLPKIRLFAYSGIFSTVVFLMLTGILLCIFSKHLSSIFSADKDVITLSAKLLLIVAVYQLFDGIQETVSGILRGMGKTIPYFCATIVGYWFIGLPFAYYFGIIRHFEAYGVWGSMTIGVLTLALSLLLYLKVHIRKIIF